VRAGNTALRRCRGHYEAANQHPEPGATCERRGASLLTSRSSEDPSAGQHPPREIHIDAQASGGHDAAAPEKHSEKSIFKPARRPPAARHDRQTGIRRSVSHLAVNRLRSHINPSLGGWFGRLAKLNPLFQWTEDESGSCEYLCQFARVARKLGCRNVGDHDLRRIQPQRAEPTPASAALMKKLQTRSRLQCRHPRLRSIRVSAIHHTGGLPRKTPTTLQPTPPRDSAYGRHSVRFITP